MEEEVSRTPPRPSMSAPTDWRKLWGKDKQVGEVDIYHHWSLHLHCVKIFVTPSVLKQKWFLH